jgi:hypothetical protein
MPKLLILPLTKDRNSEKLKIALCILLVSRWHEDHFDMRKSLIPPHRDVTELRQKSTMYTYL